jgi:uncharacterized membrane protein
MSADTPTPARRPGGSDEVRRALNELRHHLSHVERLVGAEVLGPLEETSPVGGAERGEERWPVALAVLVAIALQVALPDRLDLGPRWLLPALEGALLLAVSVANPRRVNRRSAALRASSVALVALTSLANAWASFVLIDDIISGNEHVRAVALLSNGGAVYLTNIIVFALWYWEWDRGGPAARAARERPFPDFLFPQTATRTAAPAGWDPTFVDYLYTSYTNATAFSPTDTMPLSHWAKMLMLLQSAVALTTVGLVVARAVNILR